MKRSKVLSHILLIILLISSFSVFLVKADVPSILDLSTADEDGETFLVIVVRHRSPSSNHIVDEIQIRIGDKTEIIVFESQSTVEFTERFKIDSISNEIQVRAHCNLHGWSTWKDADLPPPTPTPEPTPTPTPTPEPTPTPTPEPEKPRGIPGFPVESIIIGLLSGILLLLILNRERFIHYFL